MSDFLKYPRTHHLPWSPGKTNDDKVLKSTKHFIGKEVVVSEKMDGENTTIYTDYTHARSLDSRDHESRHWLKRYHSSIGYNIPSKWRVCGENLYAKHSIYYDELPSYYLGFSIWDDENYCLSYDETIEWANLLNIHFVPVLYRGIYDEKKIKQCFSGYSAYNGLQEGYVIRLADKFHFDDFDTSVAKFVREEHIQSEDHWMHSKVIPNGLKSKIIL